jgi:hypothetical protein
MTFKLSKGTLLEISDCLLNTRRKLMAFKTSADYYFNSY